MFVWGVVALMWVCVCDSTPSGMLIGGNLVGLVYIVCDSRWVYGFTLLLRWACCFVVCL